MTGVSEPTLAVTLRWESGDWDAARESTVRVEELGRSGSERERLLSIGITCQCLVLLERDLPRAEAMLLEAAALGERAGDVPALAEALGTEPVMIVLRGARDTELPVNPWPVDTSGIPNDHLQYAITWFSLAAVWSAMTLYFVLRTHRGRNES